MSNYKIAVLHANNPTFEAIVDCKGGYTQMAVLSFEARTTWQALNYAYDRSQNIDDAWRNPPCRSTSIGDILHNLEDDTYHMVAMADFNVISKKDIYK